VKAKESQRGLNVVALDAATHKVIMNNAYDTYGDKLASDKFVEDFKNLPHASVILVGVKDEASKLLSNEVKEIFIKMGSKEINLLVTRESWAFIGVKGAKKFVEKRSNQVVGTGAIMGYAQIVKKTKKVTKTKGGSQIEVESAGFKDGNYSLIKVNGQQVMTVRNKASQVEMNGATMSS